MGRPMPKKFHPTGKQLHGIKGGVVRTKGMELELIPSHFSAEQARVLGARKSYSTTAGAHQVVTLNPAKAMLLSKGLRHMVRVSGKWYPARKR